MRRWSLVSPSSGRSSSGPPRMYIRVLRPNLNMSPTLRTAKNIQGSTPVLSVNAVLCFSPMHQLSINHSLHVLSLMPDEAEHAELECQFVMILVLTWPIWQVMMALSLF